MDDEARERLRAAQRKLQTKWLRSLPDKCAPFRDALAANAADELRRLAHKLRGSAGSFGFADIGEAAGAAEDSTDANLVAAVEHLLDLITTAHADAKTAGRI